VTASRTWPLGAAIFTLLFTPSLAHAQGMPPMPTREQIEARVQEELDKLPTKTVENDLFSLVYKELPTDPIEYAKQAAGGQIPPGIDPNVVAKQALPFVRPVIAKYAQALGTLTPKVNLKLKSKKLSEGTAYTFGLVMNGMKPLGIVLSGGDLKRALKVAFRRGRQSPPANPMRVELIPDKRKKDRCRIHVAYAELLGEIGPFKKR